MMSDPLATALDPRRAARGGRKAFTLLEGLSVLLIMAILAGVAIVGFSNVRRTQLDAAGYPIIGAAQIDGRRVAAQKSLTFPAGLDRAMANSAAAADGRTISYVPGPSPDAEHVSVARGNDKAAGYAVMTSMQGDWSDGTASDGHCLMAVDSLTNGTTYATMTDAIRGGTNYCGAAFIALCQPSDFTNGGAGTIESPYVLTSSTTCSGTNDETALNGPQCVVATPIAASDGVTTRSARVTWVPGANIGSDFTYTIKAKGSIPVTLNGIDAGARTAQVDGLAAGERYTFEVTAVSPTGASSPASTSQQLLLVPATPALTVTPGEGKILLTWAQVPGASSYELVRVPAFVDGARKVPATDAVNGQLSVMDSAVTASTDYTYRVTVVTSEQQDSCVGPVTGGGRATGGELVSAPVLAAPTLSVSNLAGDATGLRVTWTSTPGAAKYILKASTVTSTYGASVPVTRTVGEFDAETTSVDDTGMTLPAGNTPRYVTYEMTAVNASGRESAPSRRDVGLLPPDAPVISKAAPNATSPTTALDVAWNATGDAATTYTVNRDANRVRAAASTTTFTDTALDPGTSYTYEVTASNVRFIKVYPQDPGTKTVGATVTSDPYQGTTTAAIGSLSVTPNQAARSFTASWSTVTGATSYVLEGSSDGQVWSPVTAPQTTAGATVSVTDARAGGFDPGQVRVYRLTAKGSSDSYAKPAAAALAPAYPVLSAAVADGTGDVTVSGYSTGATSVTVQNNGVGTMSAPTTKVNGTNLEFTASNTGMGAAAGTWTKYAARAYLTRNVSVAATAGKWPALTTTLRSDSALAALPAPVSSGAAANTCAVSATTVGVAFPASSTTMGCLANGAGTAWASAVIPPRIAAVTGRHQLVLTWTNPAALSDANVTRATGAASVTSTAVATAGKSPLTDTTTQDGTGYSYQIRANVPARVATGKSAVVQGLTVPPAPSLTLSNLSADSLAAAFTKTQSATGYIVVPSGTVPLTYVGSLSAAQNKVTYYGGPKLGKVAIATPNTATPSVRIASLPLEQRQTLAVYAVNAAGVSDIATSARCTAPMPPGTPTQDKTFKSKYGNQVTLLVPTRNTPCITQMSVTRKNTATSASARDEVTVKANGGTARYTATPVSAGQTYTFTVVAQGEGGSSAATTVSAAAYSAYDLLIQKHNPDLYYTFDEGPGATAIRNCANADCSIRSSGDATYDLATKSSLARVKSPFSGSGFDPVNYAASFVSANKVNAADRDYVWPAYNYTMESWVYLSSADQIGIIVGWGNNNCSRAHSGESEYCIGGQLGLGGQGKSASSGAMYYGYSSGAWGNSLTALNVNRNGGGNGGGTRLDPADGGNAAAAMAANQWHLVALTVGFTPSSGRTELRHWVDGRAYDDCLLPDKSTKWGAAVTTDYQWCTVWTTRAWNPATLLKAHPSVKGITVGGFDRVAFNGRTENRYLQSLVDNVAVYRRVLTPAEMRRHFRVGQLFFTGGDTAAKACQVADGCFTVTGSFTGGGTVSAGVRKYTIRDRGTVTAYATGRVTDGTAAIDEKSLSNTAELQVKNDDGIWVSPNPSGAAVTAAPTVTGGTKATYTFSNIGWSSADSYTYRVVTHTAWGDVIGSSFTVRVAP